ncbi:MAG: flavin reductase family protein [Balneolaceae bacterium]|nr:flavin reductase family protein [Balneolaceae bacterium]
MSLVKKKNAEDLKAVMRQFPFPVTVVTAAVGKEKRGITIGSFTSLSMDPPLVSFNLDAEAQMHDLIDKITHFAVHFPGTKQAAICDHFATPDMTGEEQFEDIDFHRSKYGTPVLNDAGAVMQCRLYNRFKAGDHTIIVGEVVEIDQPNEEASILYYDRSYRCIGDPVE